MGIIDWNNQQLITELSQINSLYMNGNSIINKDFLNK